jgi:hypothetical protein
MHYRLLVTTAPAASSLAARRQVTDGLYKSNFIESDDARWSGGIADWFVIGGRWSGLLADISAEAFAGRDRYAEFGAEDDAMLLTTALYDRFLAPYQGAENDAEYVDLEGEEESAGSTSTSPATISGAPTPASIRLGSGSCAARPQSAPTPRNVPLRPA